MTLASPIPDPGRPIEAAGVYDLTMERYHSDCCDAPSISSSGLRTIWSASPAHYFISSPYDPTPKEPEDRPHFSLGRAAHHLLFLGRKGFADEYVVRPEEWSDWRTKDARLWREAAIADGKTVLTDAELEQISGMARTLAAHPLVKAGILDGFVERSLLWKDPHTGIWLKSRPDCIPTDSGDYSDLKTCQSVETESLARSIASYGYGMQAGLVAMASEALLGRPLQTFSLVFVEVKPPYCVRVVALKPDDIERGIRQIAVAKKLFAECCASGEWPGPGGTQADAEYIELPTWSRTSIDNRLALYDMERAA